MIGPNWSGFKEVRGDVVHSALVKVTDIDTGDRNGEGTFSFGKFICLSFCQYNSEFTIFFDPTKTIKNRAGVVRDWK